MKKMKLKITFVFLLGMFLGACGGGSSDSGAGEDLSTPQGYFTARVSNNIIQKKCIACHISGEQAESTLLVYTPSSSAVHAEANFNLLQNYIQNDPTRAAKMLQKVSGEMAHTGGVQITKNSTEYNYLKTFLELIGGDTTSTTENTGDTGVGEVQDNSSNQDKISDPKAYFSKYVSPNVIQEDCIGCHMNGLVAGGSSLVYLLESEAGHESFNYSLIEGYIKADPDNGNKILDMAQGTGHPGGPRFSASDAEFQQLKAFVESLGAQVSQVDTLPTGRFWDGVEETTPEQTLRRAALIIARRMPTDQEIATVKNGGEAALRSVLRGLMQGDGFHQFLLTGSNDRLHFGAFLDGLSFEGADLQRPYFPIGAKKRYEFREENPDDWPEWERHWQWGMAISPLELIAYIVENDRSYQEVVTADYMMVSPIMDEILRSNTGLKPEDSHLEYRPGKNQGQVVPDEFLKSEFFQNIGLKVDSWGDYIDYPHAGVLSSLAFLNRYPTTETNRNRARSRWTYYHFLGLDIEKSASRTTDPVALADTNNPTMNNPACTVCHQIWTQ